MDLALPPFRSEVICYTMRTDKLDLWVPAEQALVDAGKWELAQRTERLPCAGGEVLAEGWYRVQECSRVSRAF